MSTSTACPTRPRCHLELSRLRQRSMVITTKGQPNQMITLLAGSGREEILGSSCPNTDVDVQFTRTGD